MDELPARMQAVGAAQQTGDVAKIASANRNLIASALRAMAELKLAQGNTSQSIDLYKQSLEFENTPNAHIALALAYMRAQRTDEALAEIDPITKSDPKNADAWDVQGKLFMDKKQWRPATEPLPLPPEPQRNVRVAYALPPPSRTLHKNQKAEIIFRRRGDPT